MVRHDMTQTLVVNDLKENLSTSNLKKLIEHEDKINKLKTDVHSIYDTYFPRNNASKSQSKMVDLDKSHAQHNHDSNIIYFGRKYIYINLPDNVHNRNFKKNFNDYHTKASNQDKELYSKRNATSMHSVRDNDFTKKIDLAIKDNREHLVRKKTYNPIGYSKCKGEISGSNIDYYKSEYDFNLDHIETSNVDTKKYKLKLQNELGMPKLSNRCITSSESIINKEINNKVKDSSTQTKLKHLRRSNDQRKINHPFNKSLYPNEVNISFSNNVSMCLACGGYNSSVRREVCGDYMSEEEEGTACIALTDYSDIE